MLDYDLLQQPQGNGNLGFEGDFFGALRGLSTYDLRLGSTFQGALARNLMGALRAARNTIKRMPAHYITYPGERRPIFPCSVNRLYLKDEVTLDMKFLASMGTFKVPRPVWEAMTRHAC